MSEIATPPDDPGRGQLDQSIARALAWTGILRWSHQFIRWGCTVFVARLLTPADFGLVASAGLFIGLVDRMSELGLGVAIIRHRIVDRRWIGELNTLALGLGGLTTLIAVASAGLVGNFFNDPHVGQALAWLSLSVLIASFSVVPRAVLSLRMEFKGLAMWEAVSSVTAAVIVLGLAKAGAGYWALIAGQLAAKSIEAAALAGWARLPYRWPRASQRLREEVRYGLDVVGNRLAWFFYNEADFAVVAKLLGQAALGLYGFAWQIASLPVDRVGALVGQVATPLFARVQDVRAELARYLLRLTEALSYTALPIGIGLILVAPELVQVILGGQWGPAVLPLQILAGYGIVRSMTLLLTNVLQAVGQARKVLHFAILAALVLPGLFLLGATLDGLVGVAIAWLLGYPVIFIPPTRLALREAGVTLTRYLGSMGRGLGSSLAMAGAVMAVAGLAHGANPATLLALKVLTGVTVYGAVVFTVARDRVWQSVAILRRTATSEPPSEPIVSPLPAP